MLFKPLIRKLLKCGTRITVLIYFFFIRRLWYSKMNMLRGKQDESMQLIANFCLKKDFLPAFPQEAEESHVPFLYSRLLMSHLGLIEYDHLKDGSFQILNKSPALYRDIRGLDRKHG